MIRQRLRNAVNVTSRSRRSEDVVNLMSPTFQQHYHTQSILSVERNIQHSDNVGAILWHQRCYSIVYWLHDVATLLQRFHKVLCYLADRRMYGTTKLNSQDTLAELGVQ